MPRRTPARYVELRRSCCWLVDPSSVPACSEHSRCVIGFARAQKEGFWGRRRALAQAPWRCAGERGAERVSSPEPRRWVMGRMHQRDAQGLAFVWSLFLLQPHVTRSCEGGSCDAGSLRARWGPDVLPPEGCGGLEASPAPSRRRPQPALSESHDWVSHVPVDLGLCGWRQAEQVLECQKQVLRCPCSLREVILVLRWEREDVTEGPEGSLCGRAEQPSLPATLVPLPAAAQASEESHFIYSLTC